MQDAGLSSVLAWAEPKLGDGSGGPWRNPKSWVDGGQKGNTAVPIQSDTGWPGASSSLLPKHTRPPPFPREEGSTSAWEALNASGAEGALRAHPGTRTSIGGGRMHLAPQLILPCSQTTVKKIHMFLTIKLY